MWLILRAVRKLQISMVTVPPATLNTDWTLLREVVNYVILRAAWWRTPLWFLRSARALSATEAITC